MTLKHCIIHHIERTVPGADVVTQLREQENNCAGSAYSLFEQLNVLLTVLDYLNSSYVNEKL